MVVALGIFSTRSFKGNSMAKKANKPSDSDKDKAERKAKDVTVTCVCGFAGTRRTYNPGEDMTVTADEAQRMFESGLAKPQVEDRQVERR